MTTHTDPAERAAERINARVAQPGEYWECVETIIREEYAELVAERDALAEALKDAHLRADIALSSLDGGRIGDDGAAGDLEYLMKWIIEPALARSKGGAP